MKRKAIVSCLISGAVGVVIAAASAAGTGTISESAIPTPASQPVSIVSGPDGALWFTEGFGNKIGRITPDGVVTDEYPIPTPASSPDDITLGPDGILWFAEPAGNKLGRVSPSGQIDEVALAKGSQPIAVAFTTDGNAWFTEHGTGKIGRLTTDGVVTEYTAGITGRPLVIAAGPDGMLWFTESPGNKIGRLDPATGITVETTVPTVQSAPWEIAAGPDGNLWFTERLGNKIGRITTDGEITEFPIATPTSMPNTIRSGPDPNPAKDCAYQRETLGDEAFAARYKNFGDCVSGLATTETLWFSEDAGNRIAQITTDGEIFEFPPLAPGARPGGLAEGPDGNVWFAEFGGNRIGRLDVMEGRDQ
jgi:streptogramin lyase